MAKLTDLQLVLLSAAAQRDGSSLLPLPKRLKIEPGALTRVLKGLLKKKLVAEQPAPPDAPAWREADDQRFMLVISSAGLDAIGVEPGTPISEPIENKKSRKATARRKPKGKSSAPQSDETPGATRPGTKLSLLIEMLRRDGGATISEIVSATGWQQHSVRGAISGTVKKKHGLTVTSETVEGRGRVYRIVTPAADA
jgi:hypothetical protein